MAGVTLGFLKYVLGLDTIAFRKGISQADADLAKMQRSFAAKGKEFQKLGKTMTEFVTLPLAGFAAESVHIAQKQADALGQVQAALKSTGGAAGVTAEQLKAAAEGFELHSLFESEDVLRNLSARLLAFGGINGQVFMRAQQDIIDFATRTNRDLGEATTVIGKALADPTKAAGALRRAGIVLDDSQKALIKSLVDTGNAAGAQAIILGALETKYRGSAQAAQDTKPWDKVHDAFHNLALTVGEKLLPLIPPLTNALATMIGAFAGLSPATQKWLIIIGATAVVVGPLLVAFGNFLVIISKLGPALKIVSTVMKVLSASEVLATVASVALDVALSPIVLTIGAIALALGAVYLAWKHWDQIKAIVSSVYAAVKAAFVDKLNVVWNWIEGKIGKVVELFRWMWDKLVGHSYVPDTVDAIEHHFGRLDDAMVKPAERAAKATTAVFQQLKSDVQSILDQLFPEIVAANQKAADLATLRKGLESGTQPEGQILAGIARLIGADQVDLPSTAPKDQLDTPDLQAVADKLPQMVTATKTWAAAWQTAKDIGINALQSFNDGFVDLLSKSGSFKEFWHGLGSLIHGVATDALKDLEKLALKLAEKALFSALFGGGFAKGGLVGGFASGGFVSGGGTPTSDSIPAFLSNGEFVINAAATRRFLPLLEQINRGGHGFAAGGMVAANDSWSRMSARAPAMPGITVLADFRGAEAAAVSSLSAKLDRLQREIPGQVMSVMGDARKRFVWRDGRR